MDVLGQLPATAFVHACGLVFSVTILLCYGLAVGYGHVPAWLPMISDCAVQPPEKYPFRVGIIFGASLIAAQVLLVFGESKQRSRCSLVMGLIGAFCLSVVGAVNEDENNTVHSSELWPLLLPSSPTPRVTCSPLRSNTFASCDRRSGYTLYCPLPL